MKLGQKQTLEIKRTVEFGVYLGETDKTDSERNHEVLLPKKQVPEDKSIGDNIDVFLYKDSKDRLIATTNNPKLTLGQVALLKVIEVTQIGAFLDWGLEKDLLLPFKEQTKTLKAGEEILVTLYIDKSNRLCATMKVYHYLQTDSPYKKDDRVEGIVYEISKEFGVFVAVDNCFSALIPAKEPAGNIHVGDKITARVTEVKEDGKISLSVREKAYLQISSDAEHLMEMFAQGNGSIPFTDKAAPELIREKTGMSKNEFKRAVGNLLKQGKIEILNDKIVLLKK